MGNRNICPLCLEEKTSFQEHHVIWRTEGGTDDPVNLLKICRSCHALLTFGDPEESNWYDAACRSHQLAIYGFDFIIRSSQLKEVIDNSLTGILTDLYQAGKDWDNEWAYRATGFFRFATGLLVTTRKFTPKTIKEPGPTPEDVRLILSEIENKLGLKLKGYEVIKVGVQSLEG